MQGIGNAVDIKRQPNEENVKLHSMIAIFLVHFHKVFSATHNPLLLFINSWSVGMVLDRNPGLKLSEFGRNN